MLYFYNTMTREKEKFVPLEEGKVKMYTCGPTVYDHAHIGNFRAYMFEDILRRYLKYKGYQITQVMNLTDIDDKTIKGAREKGIPINEYTETYINAFFEDIDTLNIERAELYPRATEHINEMVELIKRLIERGYAYSSDGSIYYKISNFKDYGKLSKIDMEGIKPSARVDVDEYEKEDVRDFALWKAHKEGEPYWETEIGKGRPGWHIECSAMSMKYLGETFDIHTGAVDNIFPHHENEIAQSEGATGKTFVRYWLHCDHLIVEGEKMSKSKGNFFTLRDLLNKGYDPDALRYLLLSVHYRSKLNFTEEGVNQAAQTVERLREFMLRLREAKVDEGKYNDLHQRIEAARVEFESAMDDDLNISRALGAIFQLVRDINIALDRGHIKKGDVDETIALMRKFDTVLGVIEREEEVLEEEIERLIAKREEARANKDYAEADRIRDYLAERGVILRDTKDGVRWRRKSTS